MFRVMRNVGGGGGHKLLVKNFKMIAHLTNMDEDEMELGVAPEENSSNEQGVSPEFWEIRGEDFSKNGPHDGHWCPELYFDGPTLMTRVKSLKINMSWKDQGFGNRKGKIWLQLMRNGKMVAESKDIFGNAPHDEEEVVADLIDDTVVKMARPGDMFR